jgi:hypothetical protein
MAPITDPTKGLPRKFVWTKEGNGKFFLKLKLVPTMLNYSEEFVMFCDVSGIGVGATLLQDGKNPSTQRMVAYFFQKLHILPKTLQCHEENV